MNGSIMKIAGEEALKQNIREAKAYVEEHGGGGHTVLDNSGTALTQRSNLQFQGVHVDDDSTNNKTIVKPQIQICATEAEWNQMSDAQKNDPLVYWYLPWATENVYASDKTPIGTVINMATGKTGDGITGITTPTNPFPNENYLICNGDNISLTEYPQLANYFEARYGNKYYFNSGGLNPNNGTFKLPTWTADYPENGIICIKARITSDVITFAEVDETGLSSRTDEVPNCARVAADETVIFAHSFVLGDRIDIKGTSGYTTLSNGYLAFVNNNATSGTFIVEINGVSMLQVNYGDMSGTERRALYIKKGMTIKDSNSTLNSYFLFFIPFT